MIYAGADLSTTSTGFSILEDEKLLYYECIKPKTTIKDWKERVEIIARRINEIFKEFDIEECYVEDVPLKDGKPTIHKLSVVRGVLVSTCAINHVKLYPQKVSEWRKHSDFYDGTTNGLKREVMKQKAIEEVESIFGIRENDDVCESILVAYRTKYPIK